MLPATSIVDSTRFVVVDFSTSLCGVFAGDFSYILNVCFCGERIP